jgi:fructose-bisphosphate aldolase, class I
VLLEGLILKPNMILPGLGCPLQPTAEVVAETTITTLLRVVPAAVAGIAFLSGGQSGELASARLNAMNIRAKASGSRVPWPLVFSFARAIQCPTLETWDGQAINTARAQQALYHRASCNHAALRGDYTADMESA